MKKSVLLRCYILLWMMLAVFGSSGQTSKTPLDRGFIDKTITYYYGKQVALHPGTYLFFIEKDSFNMNAKTDYGAFKVQFISKEAAAKIIKGSKRTAQIDRIGIKWVSLDTIDVSITRCTIIQKQLTKTVNGKKSTTTEISLGDCSDANVEIPTCRFVYSQTTSAWTQLDDGRLVKKH